MIRSSDGTTLLVTSSDGFCSTVSFSPSDLGEVLKGDPRKTRQEAARQEATEAAASSAHTTPIPTPTSQFAPPSPFPNGSHHRHRDSMSSFAAPSPPAAAFVNQRPSSPARSNSTSSIITQTSTAPAGPPTLLAGSVPGLTATNSGKVTGVPITTPPETPRSAAGSTTGQKRDLSESEKEDSEGQPKKKRIAPTLISGPGTDPKP